MVGAQHPQPVGQGELEVLGRAAELALAAEVAGVMEGFAEGELDEPLTRRAAGLWRKAGADPEAIRDGSRAAPEGGARMPPPSGDLYGR